MINLVAKIEVGEANKIELYKASSKVFLWWKNSEKWFCNIQSNAEAESHWIIASDLERYLNAFYIKNKYSLKEL